MGALFVSTIFTNPKRNRDVSVVLYLEIRVFFSDLFQAVWCNFSVPQNKEMGKYVEVFCNFIKYFKFTEHTIIVLPSSYRYRESSKDNNFVFKCSIVKMNVVVLLSSILNP